jgi:hypothetical protein
MSHREQQQEEQQRFDKTQMLSFLPPEIMAADATLRPPEFKEFQVYYQPV